MINELSKNDILFGFSIVVLVIFVLLVMLIIFHILKEASQGKEQSLKGKVQVQYLNFRTDLIAGEDLEFGDCVIFGEDGKIYKAKQ